MKFVRKVKHRSIIELERISYEKGVLTLITEFGDDDLCGRMRKMKTKGEIFGELTIKRHIKSMLEAVKAIHEAGYLHLDLKPENMIFVGDELKLTDFGTVFDYRSYKIDQETNVFLRMNPYVSTRWYRAPECVMECLDYSTPVDVFALGCVMAEMFMFNPLFPGINQ